MRIIWIDLRTASGAAFDAIRQAAIHARADAVVDADPARLAELPPTVTKVYAGADLDGWARDAALPDASSYGDDIILLLPVTTGDELARLADRAASVVPFVRVHDQTSLELACASASRMPRTVVEFTDPTKIPLEIVIAAADKVAGELICTVVDAAEAAIVLGVLEKGSEGIMHAPQEPAQVVEMHTAVTRSTPSLPLTSLEVIEVAHVGMGDRVCVDTCSQFHPDEGILVGSFAHGFILCCSETHPLPYMPTRPFRVNAGALHSYVLQDNNRTNYLSELRAGMHVLAARADGTTRQLVIGRAKLERRPLLQITAMAADTRVCLTAQDDWHVRVLGPGGAVLNITELQRGTQVLGYVATDRRHVGYPVDEFCLEV